MHRHCSRLNLRKISSEQWVNSICPLTVATITITINWPGSGKLEEFRSGLYLTKYWKKI